MAKFGDDRSRDRNIDTDMDFEELDRLSVDDPSGGSFGMEDDGGRSPARATRQMVTETAKGAAKGAMSVIDTEVERNMPNLYTVKTELTDTYQDLKDVKDEISKQLQPMMISMENSARKILPRVSKLMPKSWYDKVKTKLDARAEERSGASAQRSKEQERSDLITSELSSIFEQQVEVNKHNEFEHHKEKLMDRAVSSTQHKAQQHALARIYDATRSTELFHRTLHTAYMKKSLELKFKHLFVAQDTHNLLAKSLDAFEGYFKGIVKNTGLPDVMKTQASDYIKQSRTQRYGTLMADYLSNARQMIIGNIKRKLKEVVEGFGMGAMALDTGASALEMMDDPMMNPLGLKGMAAGFGGQLLGKALAAGPVRTLMEKISPFTSALDTRLENVKTRAAMSMNNLRKRLTRGGGFFGEFLASLLPSISAPSSMSNDLLSRGEEAAVFDKATRMSIVEIIPGYLGKIWHSVDRLTDPNAKEKIYNVYQRDFTTVEDFRKDIFSDSRMSGNVGGQTAAVSRMISTIAKGNERHQDVLHGDELLEGLHDALSRFVSNHAGYRVDFEPESIAEYNKADIAGKRSLIERSTYIARISEGIEFETFNQLVRVISSGMTGKNGNFDGVIVRDIKNAIDSTRTNSDGMVDYVPWAREAMGFSRVLRGMNGKPGIINKDDTYNMAYVNARNAKIGSFKEIEGYKSIYDRNIDEVYGNEDEMARRMKEIYDKHSSVRWAAGKYNQFANYLRTRGDKSDEIELGPIGGTTTESKLGVQPSSSVKKDLGDKFFRNAEELVTKDPTKKEQVDSLIKELNDSYREIQSLELAEADEKNMLDTVRKQVLRKHKFTVGDINGVNVNAALRAGKAKAAKVLDVFGLKSAADKVRGADTSGTVETAEEWKKKHGSVFKRLSDAVKGKYDKALGTMENLTPEQIEQKVAEAKQALVDAPANMKQSDLVQLIKGERKLRDILHKRYPNSKAVKEFDKLITGITGSREYKAIMNASAAVGTYARGVASPYVDKMRTWAEPAYTRLRAFSNERINKFCADHNIDPDLVRRARDGDQEAQEELYQTMKSLAGDQWASLKSEFSKDKMMKRWATTRDFLKPENLASQAGKKAGIFSAFARETISGVKQAFSKSYSDAMGVEDEAGEGVTLSSAIGGEEPSPKATVEDNSSLIRVIREFNASTSREHEGLADLIHITINTLKGGIGSIPKDANDKRAAKDEAMISRKRYGLFGKGGEAVGSAIKSAGRGALWAIKKTGKLYAATYTGAVGAAGAAAKGIIGGVSRVAGWLSNTAGLNPYVDIYVKGQEGRKPIITWRKQAYGDGVYYGVLKGRGSNAHWEMSDERVKSSSDIVKRKVPIFDPKTGNMLINEDDIKAGLWAPQSGLTSMAMAGTAAIRSFGDIYSAALKGLGGVANTIAQGIFGTPGAKKEKYVDIYLKDQVDGHPLVTRRQQERPGVFFVEDGKRVERSSDIHSPVMDKKRNILIDEKDIEHGLVDVDNKPLGSSKGGREGLLGKAFDLGGIIAKGIFGKTGIKIVGGALSGIGAMYKGLFDALLGGGKAIGRGMANIGARLFGFDTPGGFGNKAVKSITSRLDTIIALLSRGGGYGGGRGSGGPGPASPADAVSEDYFEGKRKSGRGRRGYWKSGKFIPDRNGDSYELDGIDHPGGAAYGLTGAAASRVKSSDNLRSNAKASVRNSAKDDYKETVHELDDEGGEESSSDSGIGLIDALLLSPYLPKSIKKKILKGRKAIGKKASAIKKTALKKVSRTKLGKTVAKKYKTASKSVSRGYKAVKGGISRALRHGGKATRVARGARTVAKGARLARGARGARLLAKGGRIGALAAGGAALWHTLTGGGGTAAATGASRAATSAARTAGRAAGAAGNVAGGATTASTQAAKHSGKIGKIMGALAKPLKAIAKAAGFAGKGVTRALGGVAKTSSKVLGKVLGKAAAPLGLLLAGDSAQEARENAELILGKENVTEAEKDTLAAQAAMDEMGSGALLGLDHLILGKNVNKWIGEKLYGDENAEAKAAVDIDKEIGMDKFSLATNLGDKVKDYGWYNPVKWGAKIIDGTTGVTDSLGKGAIRIVGGTGKAAFDAGDALNGWLKARQGEKKLEASKKTLQEKFIDALKPATEGYDIGVGLKTGAKTGLYDRIKAIYDKIFFGKGRVATLPKVSKEELDEKYNGCICYHPSVIAAFKKYVRDNFPPTDPKGKLAFFMRLYKSNDRAEKLQKNNVLKVMFGINDPYYAEDWDRARSNLENIAGVDGQKALDEYKNDPATEATEAAATASTAVGKKSAAETKTATESRTYKVGEASGKKFSDASYGKGVLDYDSIVKGAVAKFGGPAAVAALGLSQFQDKLVKHLTTLPEYQKLDDDKQDHAEEQLKTIASEVYSDCKTEAQGVASKIGQAIVKQPDTASAAAASATSTNQVGKQESPNAPIDRKKFKSPKLKRYEDCVDAFIESIGGVKVVRTMRYGEFRNKYREFINKNWKKYIGETDKNRTASHMMQKAFKHQAEMNGIFAYASAFGIEGKFTAQGNDLIDPRTGKPVELDPVDAITNDEKAPTEESKDTSKVIGQAIVKQPDKSLLAPDKKKEVVTPEALEGMKLATRTNNTDKVVGAIKDNKQTPAMTNEQIYEMYANWQKMFSGYMKFTDSFNKAVGPDGLNVHGMRELTTATLMRPEGGTTQIIREVPVPQENGLDLAAKQY